MARYRPWVQYTTEIATSKKKKIGLDADEATYREKRREYKFTISKKNISSVQNYCDQALLDNKNKKLGETVSHVRQKKETSENQYQNMARPLPDYSGPSR